MRSTRPASSCFLTLVVIILEKEYKSYSSSLCNCLQCSVTYFSLGKNVLYSTLFSNNVGQYSFLAWQTKFHTQDDFTLLCLFTHHNLIPRKVCLVIMTCPSSLCAMIRRLPDMEGSRAAIWRDDKKLGDRPLSLRFVFFCLVPGLIVYYHKFTAILSFHIHFNLSFTNILTFDAK